MRRLDVRAEHQAFVLVLGERNDLLQLSVVEQLKVCLLETANRPAFFVDDNGVYLDEVCPGSKGRLLGLRLGEAIGGQDNRETRDKRDCPGCAPHST